MADLSSGLTTRVDTSQEPARLRVEWIDWASPFRGAAVGVGDTVLAVDGVPVDPLASGGAAQRLPGGYAEAQAFEAAGRKAGDPLKLTVRRPLALGGTVSEVGAPLAEVSSARNADNQPILPPDGPVAMERDDLPDNWGAWADQLRAKLTYLLDVERHTATFVSRFEAKELRERHGDRVGLAIGRYPGAWSSAVKADYDAALKLLEGEAIVLPPGALDFRDPGRRDPWVGPGRLGRRQGQGRDRAAVSGSRSHRWPGGAAEGQDRRIAAAGQRPMGQRQQSRLVLRRFAPGWLVLHRRRESGGGGDAAGP
jgi:hypothetical protein